MSEQNDTFGEVENGERLPVAFGTFSGIAGIRRRESGREVAYLGAAPRSFPVVGRINGEEATATASIKSKLHGFAVLWVPDPR